mmetsp:Transcript_66963/g.146025  ORF Transcript_66963/g.146025 Transcript_66963/m.146025 type:complete len:241 (-) Transcript_66963:144-866(-)
MTMASTPASARSRTRSLSAGRVPMAAATISLFSLSFVARGYSAAFLRSVRVMRATSRPSLFRMGSLPFLESRMIWLAAGSSMPSSAVTSSALFVIASETGVEPRFSRKSVSRFVTRPSSSLSMLPSFVTTKPVKPTFFRRASSSSIVIDAGTQMGCMMKPFLYFFTLATSSACTSAERLVWMTPMPPSRAIAMAMFDSVTVSIGLDTIGVFRAMFREKRDSRVTSCTPKLIDPGRQMRSS